MAELISIVVPIYNAGEYLEKCIISILNQTYKDFELLLVNDGSTDESGMICERFAEKDSRIKYIIKENTGVSDSRNLGISQSKGAFITFIDADDWIDCAYLQSLYEGQQLYDADIVVSGLQKEFEDNSTQIIKVTDILDVIDSKKALSYACNPEQPVVGFAVCKLIRKEVITNNRIIFDGNIKVNEDSLFNYEVTSCSKKIVRVPSYFYHYRIRSGSVTDTARIDLSKYRTRITAFEKALSLPIQKEENPQFFLRVTKELFKTIIYYIHHSFADGIIPADIDDLLNETHEIKKDFEFRELNWMVKMEYRMCRINYIFFQKLVYWRNRW